MSAMYPQSMPPGFQVEGIPPKVQAAMQFLHFADNVRRCGAYQPRIDGDSPKEDGRELSKTEAEVYDSALTTLLEYFNTTGFSSGIAAPPKPDDGSEPEKVTA